MLDPEQIQALAIIMVGAFLMVLATAVFYVFAFRPRLLAPNDDLRHDMAAAQPDAVESLARLVQEQASKLDEHTRILVELDRELDTQAAALRGLDASASDHARLLTAAADERRQQTSLIERLGEQVAHMVSLLTQSPSTGPGSLIDIKGIGPAYSKRLRAAGITTFQQLAAMTPDDIHALIDAPAWRKRSINVESWIEQAKQFAAQKGEP